MGDPIKFVVNSYHGASRVCISYGFDDWDLAVDRVADYMFDNDDAGMPYELGVVEAASDQLMDSFRECVHARLQKMRAADSDMAELARLGVRVRDLKGAINALTSDAGGSPVLGTAATWSAVETLTSVLVKAESDLAVLKVLHAKDLNRSEP